MLKTQYFIDNQEIRKKFFASIALVITKSEKKRDFYLAKLKKVIDFLEKNENKSHS